MNRQTFIVHTLSLAAQTVRDLTGKPLCQIEFQPKALLVQIERALILAQFAYDAGRVMALREQLAAAISAIKDETLCVLAPAETSVEENMGANLNIEIGNDDSANVRINAGLLFFDLCVVLELDDRRAELALSLADWCDIQRLVGESVCLTSASTEVAQRI